MKDQLPESAVPGRIGAAGLIGFVFGLCLSASLDLGSGAGLIVLVFSAGAPMWLLEVVRIRPAVRVSEAMLPSPDESSVQSPLIRRQARMCGLLVAALLWGLTLSVLPLADSGSTNGFWEALPWLSPALLLAGVLYISKPGTTPANGLELVGHWWLSRAAGHAFPFHVLRDQLVKAFFLPLMLAFAYDWGVRSLWVEQSSGLRWYLLPLAVLYLLDTIFASVGYLSTSRRLESHIRSSNPYWLGWAAALVCYPPFFIWLQQSGFNYRDGYEWHHWLGVASPVAWAWGGAILLLTAIYAWATVAFGIRFSNLTHRGIITNGPYRYTKHPAYLSKNISWWLVSVPFISTCGPYMAILHCLILLGINGIYWLRAKTEEKHLMADPVYRRYADWVARHGLLAWLRGRLSFFRTTA